MGKITDDLERQIKELKKELENKAITNDEREFVEEEIKDLEKELEDAINMVKKPDKKGKKETEKKDKQTNSEWEGEIIEIASDKLGMSNSDAQGWFDTQSFYSAQAWTKGLSANKAFDYIQDKTETKKEESKTENSDSTFKPSKLKVGESAEDHEGNTIKHNEAGNYILNHKETKETVAFVKEGDKWVVDCCKKKGIEFSATEIDNAVNHIIEGLDCHVEYEKRKEGAIKRKEAAKKREAMPKTDLIENTIQKAVDSVENRVEDIKKEGNGISPSKAKSFGFDIQKLVKVIDKGIKDQDERKKFVSNVIKELQKLL